MINPNWRKINSQFYWCPDTGSATKLEDGWYASNSGYQNIVLKPSVGSYKTAKQAIEAFTKLNLR